MNLNLIYETLYDTAHAVLWSLAWAGAILASILAAGVIAALITTVYVGIASNSSHLTTVLVISYAFGIGAVCAYFGFMETFANRGKRKWRK